jgi:hypothetical protein
MAVIHDQKLPSLVEIWHANHYCTNMLFNMYFYFNRYILLSTHVFHIVICVESHFVIVNNPNPHLKIFRLRISTFMVSYSHK